MTSLESCIARAFRRREAFKADDGRSAFRAIDGRSDTMPGVALDIYGHVGVLSLYLPSPADQETELLGAIRALTPIKSLYLKRRPPEASRSVNRQTAYSQPIFGQRVDEVAVLENGLQYVIRPANGLSVGLFLDMRDIRLWFRSQVQGKSTLNCFSYTCAFGVVGQAGGARKVVNIDASRKVLDWGRQNAQLNGQPEGVQDYVAGDVFSWLKRFAKRQETFDWVILDPPSFATTKESRFSAGHDYPKLVAMAARVVAPGGRILACCNLSTMSRKKFHSLVRQGLNEAGRPSIESVDLYPSDIDFPVPPGEEAPLKVIALRLG